MLRIAGVKYNNSVANDSYIWDYDEDHAYIQIVIIYQILLTTYKCWVIKNKNEINSYA